MSFRLSHLATFLTISLSLTPLAQALSNGTFEWPASTQQCGTYNVTIYNGVPPWTVVLAPPITSQICTADTRPINGQPIYWDVSAPPRYDPSRSVNAQIPLQLASGTAYTVFAIDSTGYFTGVNPVEIQTVGLGTDQSCLSDVLAHSQDFTFTTSGNTTQCAAGFGLSWVDNLGLGPYNFTVLPLDTSTNPFDVALRGGPTTTGETGWAVNMTAGTRFTIMMNNAYGTGRGGIGGIYQVAPGSSNSCITAPIYTTSAWPAGLQTTTLLTAAALPTSVITSRSARPSSSSTDLITPIVASGTVTSTAGRDTAVASSSAAASGSSGGLSTGAAAGIGAGIGVAAIAAVVGIIFWWLRKKKNAAAAAPYPRQVDLGDEPRPAPQIGFEPKVEPFPSPLQTPGVSQQPEMAYQASTAVSSPIDGQSHGYPNQAAFGAAGAAGAAYSLGARSSEQLSPHDRFSVSSGQSSAVNPYFPPSGISQQLQPGQAGPLPSKADLARQSYQPSPQQQYGSGGLSPGSTSPYPMSPASLSGSDTSGRQLPPVPGQFSAGTSEAGQTATSTDYKGGYLSHFPGTAGASNASNAGTTGHAPLQGPSGFMNTGENVQSGNVEFRRHQDAEMPQPDSGVVDLPPLYQDVPQARSQGSAPGQSPQ